MSASEQVILHENPKSRKKFVSDLTTLLTVIFLIIVVLVVSIVIALNSFANPDYYTTFLWVMVISGFSLLILGKMVN